MGKLPISVDNFEREQRTRTEHIISEYVLCIFAQKFNYEKNYIGYTSDLRRRIREHKNRQPELIYYEAYKDKRNAREREKKLKQRGQTIRRLKEKLKYSLS